MSQIMDRATTPGAVATTALALIASSIVALGAARAGSWDKQAPLPTRFATDGVDMVSATEAWAVAYTDIVHTTDGGATWESRPRPGNDNLHSIDFFDSQHGIATGNTTLYTRDGGATWSQGVAAAGYDVEMADADLAFVTDHRVAGYSFTTDGGATWAFKSMPSNITTIQAFDSLNAVAASPSGVYHTYDGGLGWSFVPGQGATYAGTHFTSHASGWIVLGNSASHTTDGGATWQPQTLPAGTWVYDVMFSDDSNGWGVGDNVVRTTNGGATWQKVPLPAQSLPLWDVDFADASHGIAGGDSFLNTDSVIITSDDGGATWDTKSSGSINDVLDMVALDCDHAWTSHDYGGKTSRTTDGGRTWQVTEVGNQYLVLGGIDMADALHGWTVGFDTTYLESYIYHTSDGAASWQRQFAPDTDVLRAVAALDAQTAIIVGGSSSPARHRTTDGGATWQAMNVPIGAYFYDVFFLDDQTGWMVGGNGDIVKSTDGGDTWTVQPNPAIYTLASVHFSDPDHGWAGGYYEMLVRTTDGGASWTLQDPQIPEYTHVLDVSSSGPTEGWIAGYGGGASSRPFVKHTTDGGTTWIDHTPTVGPYDAFSALAFLGGDYGWAAGAGGIFRHGTPSCREIVTGAGPGAANAPVVKTWNHGNPPAPIDSWTAYGTPQYGVNVAAIDISGSGAAEAVTGPGPGAMYGPQVRGFDAMGGAISKVNFFAYGTLRYGAHTAGGDLDGDGWDEILSTPGPGAVFGPHVRGWNFDGGALAAMAKVSFFPYATLRYGARSAGGDVDGDTFREILTGAGAGAIFAPHVRGFDYDGASITAMPINLFAFGTGRYGAVVAAGDTDGDGRDDIAAARGPDPDAGLTADVKGFVFTGTGVANSFAFTAFNQAGGAELAAGDLDANGRSELAAGAGWGTAAPSTVRVFEIVGAGALRTLDYAAYAWQAYGTKVAMGDIDSP